MKNKSQMASRRRFLLGVGASLGSFGILNPVATSAFGAGDDGRPAAKLPFIHTTDLYSPPQDPDDHVDLATVFALPELDLRAVILDPTRKFVGQHDPGFVPVAQLNYLTGQAVPVNGTCGLRPRSSWPLGESWPKPPKVGGSFPRTEQAG